MGAAFDTDSDDQDAEQLARDGVRPLPAGESLDARSTRSLLSSARHELGSPLQSVQGFAELLASEAFGALSQQQHSFLEHILTASSELRRAMDACLELAELELLGRTPSSPQRGELQSALLTTLEQVQQRMGVVISAQPSSQRTHVMLDHELFGRAFERLLIALSVRDDKGFVVAIEVDAEYALISVARAGRLARAETVPLPTLARRPMTRNLLWFRLAGALFAAQDATLSLAEALDYAEVRLRLRPTH